MATGDNVGIKFFWNFYTHALSASGAPNPHGLLVNTYNRNLVYSSVDFAWQARIAPGIARTYNAQSDALETLGRGWFFNLGERLEGIPSSFSPSTLYNLTYVDGTGAEYAFSFTTTGGGVPPANPLDLLDNFMTANWDTTTSRFYLQEKNGLIHWFDLRGRLHYLEDPNGNTLHCRYVAAAPASGDIPWRLAEVYTVTSAVLEHSLIDTFDYTWNETLDQWILTRVGNSAIQTYWTYQYDDADPVSGPGTATGTATGLVPSATVLINALATFLDDALLPGDYIRNVTDGSTAEIVSVDSNTQITTTSLAGGGDNQWQVGDQYQASPSGGTATTANAAGTSLIDSAATFLNDVIAPGDLVTNVTDGSTGTVVSISSNTTLILSGLSGGVDNDWDVSDLYRITPKNGRRSLLDGDGYLTKVTDPIGHRWQYSYIEVEEDGTPLDWLWLNTITDPNGGVTTLAYAWFDGGLNDPNWNLTLTDAEGGVVTFNNAGMSSGAISTTYTDARGEDWAYQQDALSRLTVFTDPLSNTTQYTYGGTTTPDDNLPTAIEDARSNTTSYTYDANGNILTYTPPLGFDTTYTYATASAHGNRRDLVATKTIDDTGEDLETAYEYDDRGNRISEMSPLGHTKEWEYDQINGDLLKSFTAQQVADGKRAWNSFEYDTVYGVMTRRTDPTGAVRTTAWSPLGRFRLAETDPLGNTTSFGYDALGRMTSTQDPLGFTTSTGYDGLSNVLTTIDPVGATTQTVYDRLNRALSRTQALGTITSSNLTVAAVISHTAYDANGNVTRVTDPLGVSATMVYDTANRKTSETQAVDTDVETTIAYEYDAVGNLTRSGERLVGGRWRFSESEYDALNRVTASAEASVPDDDGTWATALADYTAARGMWGPYARTSTTTYDDRGFVATQTGPEFEFDGIDHNNITAVDSTGPVFSFSVAENLTAVTRATRAWVKGSTSNDGIYTIVSITPGTPSLITVAEEPPDTTVDGTIAVLLPDWEYTYDDDGRRVAALNANNVTQETGYDDDGRVIAQYAPGADAAQLSVTPQRASRYNGLGQLIEATDATGNTTGYTYDLAGRQETVTDPKGNTSRTVYDAAGRVVQQIDALGNITTFVLDPAGRPLEAINPLGQAIRTEYDKLGRRISQTTAVGYVTKWTYDALGRVVVETPPNGGTMTSTYDALGRRTAVSDAYNNVTTTAYDALGRTVSVTDPIGNETAYEYADFDQPTLVTLADGSEIATTYNKRGMTLEVDLPNGDERLYTYDVLGRTKTEDNIDGDTTTYVYDNLNRVTSTTYPNGLAIAQEYDPAGRLTKRTKSGTGIDPAETEQWTYDANGNQTTFTDADGKVWSSTYDALNRLSATETPNSTPAAPARHTRVYDAAGRLVQRTDAKGQTIAQIYNADGQLVEIDYPDQTRVIYAWNCCRLTGMQDAFGVSAFKYDLGNRVIAASDPFGHLLRYQYDANGRLVQLTLPGGGDPIAYTYSPLGLIDEITDTNGDVTAFTYGATTGGQLVGIDWGNGADVDYTWDTNGVLQTAALTDSGGTTTETYTPADTTWPVASPLKASVTWGGNAYATATLDVRDDMRVTAERYNKAGTAQFLQNYTTSPANNLTSIEDLVAFPDITTTNQFFDAASFLRGRVAEEYSAIDNAIAVALATNPQNIVTDVNGNIIRIDLPTTPGAGTLNRWEFTYDFENRLTKVVYTDGLAAANAQAWEFGYDGLGRRVWTQINGMNAERYVYNGDQLLQSRSAADDALNMEYTYGPAANAGSSIFKQWDGTTKEWFYTSPQDAFPRFKMDHGGGTSGDIVQIYQYTTKGDYVAGYAAVADAPAFGWRGKWAFGLDTPLPVFAGNPAYFPALMRSAAVLLHSPLFVWRGGPRADGIVPRIKPASGAAGQSKVNTSCCTNAHVGETRASARDTKQRGCERDIPGLAGWVPFENPNPGEVPDMRPPEPEGGWSTLELPTPKRQCQECVTWGLYWARLWWGNMSESECIPTEKLRGCIEHYLNEETRKIQFRCVVDNFDAPFGCTSCGSFSAPKVYLNCTEAPYGVNPGERRDQFIGATILHELLHVCLLCNEEDHNPGFESGAWLVIQACMAARCIRNCLPHVPDDVKLIYYSESHDDVCAELTGEAWSHPFTGEEHSKTTGLCPGLTVRCGEAFCGTTQSATVPISGNVGGQSW